MKIANWLVETMKKLGATGVDSPRRDALVLLEDTLEKDRAWVLAHPEYELDKDELKKVNDLVERRIKREPLAYIREKAWFYGRFFAVNKNVLIPRPESEDFIDILKELKPKTIVDIGTGSGALAITAKLELPESQVIATDIDTSALTLAKHNADIHNVSIKFLHGSLLEPIKDVELKDYTIIANLPYVPDELITSPEIIKEPKLALFSGTDGLDHYRDFWQQVERLEDKPTYILVESLEAQQEELKTLAKSANYKVRETKLLISVFEQV